MDNSNLIDLNKEECKGCNNLISPLIPVPQVNDRRLSDVENNPFDKVLRTISNKNDPFECVLQTTSFDNNNKNLILNDVENKENVGYLISPIQTPIKQRKHKKISSAPLFLESNAQFDHLNTSLTVPFVSNLQNSSLDCNVSNVSLQLLNDSILNISDVNLNDSFQLALNLPLPSETSAENDILKDDNNDANKCIWDIPMLVINNDNKSYENSGFNNAFIDHSNKLSTKSSVNTPTSFNTASLGKSEISNIFPSTSSNNSAEVPSTHMLNDAFLLDSASCANTRKCMSARKAKNSNFASDNHYLNNSFGGFKTNDEIVNPYKFCKKYDNDSVFLEGSYLAQSFRAAPPIDFEDELISTCTPPWLEENTVFVASDNDETVEKDNKNVQETKSIEELNASDAIRENQEEEIETNPAEELNDEKDNSDVQNAKDLLQNLSRILNKSGDVVDQRTLGENLLNSLALALNIDNRQLNKDCNENKSFKMQRSKSDSKVNEKLRQSNGHVVEKKVNVPKLKIQAAAPVKLDKNLKPKSEKEKVTAKGPLKALIPLANVTKAKTNASNKPTNSLLTPPKNSQYQIKKTSTPNETKLKSPIAQSTPDLYYKKSSNDANKITPVSKRQFGFSLSPLARPASSNDISNISLNKSISPKQTSASIPNLNTSLNKSSGSGCGAKNTSNSSIPTITRRNSVSEINSTRNTNTFNRSFENNKPARTSQLKRSSSFQSKINASKVTTTAIATTTTTTTSTAAIAKSTSHNNNTVKKYGMPGKIKPLKLIPKSKKSAGN